MAPWTKTAKPSTLPTPNPSWVIPVIFSSIMLFFLTYCSFIGKILRFCLRCAQDDGRNYAALRMTVRNYAALRMTVRNYAALRMTVGNCAALRMTVRNYAALRMTVGNCAALRMTVGNCAAIRMTLREAISAQDNREEGCAAIRKSRQGILRDHLPGQQCWYTALR